MLRTHPRDVVTAKRRSLQALWRRRWRLPTARTWAALTALLLLLHALAFWGTTRPSPHIAETLWALASRPMTQPRGIVLPLFDGIALLGISLIMELRAMHIDLPIEVPHCGDLSDSFITVLTADALLRVRAYDVCVHAADATEIGPWGNTRALFCEDMRDCHKRFRSFDIKVLAVLFSQFEELLMLDADVLFLQSPLSLWELDKFTSTGTLFFNDRISFTDMFLAQRTSKQSGSRRSKLHEFVETFDRAPFERLPTVPRRRRPSDPRDSALRTPGVGTPSDYLASTHTWQLRAGHHADSSLMLWSKHRQPRATAILGSFVTLAYAHRPSSYGDKEFYFLACEVADAAYAFSDFGVGAIGVDARLNDGVLCGDALHFYPVADSGDDASVLPLYINSDHIASWRLDHEPLYRTNARRASVFPGSFEEKNLPQECPFDVTMQPLTARETELFQRRQRFYRDAEALVAAVASVVPAPWR